MFNGKTVCIAGKEVKLTNLEKIFWPEGLTKAHLVKYYTDIAPVLLPYLYDRPLVMKRYPDGIAGEAFYQKECPDYAPPWIKTHPVTHSGKIIRYVICNDLATLVWLANQACIPPGPPGWCIALFHLALTFCTWLVFMPFHLR